ncbi:MAG: OmpA family protein [Flavobacteriaceae bacterium]|nr:OmpA family protein [Flavobacteriaceae bacterium]
MFNISNNLSVLIFLFFSIGSFSQESLNSELVKEKQIEVVPASTVHRNPDLNKYNHWSVTLNMGVNVPVGPYTVGHFADNPNYFISPNFNHYDLNVRKMFSTKFGLLISANYDSFRSSSASLPFDNSMYSTSLQGVVNIHRLLKWEEFTNSFGLQWHFGPSLSFLESSNSFKGSGLKRFSFDNVYGVVGGMTVLTKISNRISLNLDYTLSKNFSYHLNLDGTSKINPSANRTGVIHYASFGANFYFGKLEKHADWYWEDGSGSKEDDLAARIEQLEAIINNVNSSVVGNKGDLRSIPVDPSVYNYVEGDYLQMTNIQARNFINSQYVNVFFDFDQSRISTGSISAINFLVKYLLDNPQAKVEVIGYADEIGDTKYNFTLSNKRANNVAEMIERSGIDRSRLIVITKGEDSSVPKESRLARQLVRRVVFSVF